MKLRPCNMCSERGNNQGDKLENNACGQYTLYYG